MDNLATNLVWAETPIVLIYAVDHHQRTCFGIGIHMPLANRELDGADVGALVSAQCDVIGGRGDCCASMDTQICPALNSGFRIEGGSGARIGKECDQKEQGEDLYRSRSAPFATFRLSSLRNGCNDVAREIHELLARRIARYGRKLHFRFRHWPLPWRGLASRRRDRVFAGQFLVGQAAPERGTCSFDETHPVAGLALIIAECLFIQVAEQMEGLDAEVGAFQSAFEQAPEVFDSVCCTFPSTYSSA